MSTISNNLNLVYAKKIYRVCVIFLILGLITIALCDYCYADLASEAEMEQVCRNWLIKLVREKGAWDKSSAPQIIAVNTLEQNGQLLARYYSISPKGFVLVPILKELNPVKAYSMENNLDSNQEQGFIALIKDVLSYEVETYLSVVDGSSANGETVFSLDQRKLWDIYTLSENDFLNTLSKDKQPLDEAGPLMTSRWYQRYPYWNDCPIDGNGRCLVGCLATAMAQILYYWKWPDYGYGNHSYMWYNDYFCGYTVPPQVISADFSDDYDWDNMVDSCTLGCTPTQQQALAELNYEVGISLQSIYGSCLTAAEICPWSYITYFKYSGDVKTEHRRYYDTEGWFAVIREEIDNNRPIQYLIWNHSIVCDGYRDDGSGMLEYHLIYGWANSFDAWYVLDNLPCPWWPGGQSPLDHEYMVTHIEPQTEPYIYIKDYELHESEGNGDGIADPGELLFLTVIIENMGVDAHNAQGELSTDDSYINEVSPPSVTFDTPMSHGSQSTQAMPFLISIDEGCPDPRIAVFEFTVSADSGYTMTDSILIFIGNTAGFADDFESGHGFWDHRAFALRANDEWHLETSRAHSGTHSWKAGGSGDETYVVVQDAGLISQPILLPRLAELTFWHWMDSEIDQSSGAAWDGGIVMISTGGRNWTQIYPDGGYSHTMVEFSGVPIGADTPCFSGTHDWKQEIFDLSEYSGVVQIMFRFDADALTTLEGWYIDDISIAQGIICGDANGDGDTNIGDAVYLINFVFKGGPAPDPICSGNVNGDADTNIGDAVYIINYVFKGGPAPGGNCCGTLMRE